MKRAFLLARAALLVGLALPGATAAQTAPPGPGQKPDTPDRALPPGHPPLGAGERATTDRRARPSAPGPSVSQPSPGASAGAPENKPAEVAAPDPETADPHAAGSDPSRFEPPADSSEPSPDLPVGTIQIRLVDARGGPLAGKPVRLGILRQSIAQGDSREQRSATTDSNGAARFSDLAGGSSLSYRVTTEHSGATYASAPFTLAREMGQSVLLHVYPVTADINQVLIGMRAILHIEPRDDVFQFEAMFQVFNIGRVTWLPAGAGVGMPSGFKAFNAQESMYDARFAAVGDEVRLQGSFPPGQREAAFRFQTPSDDTESTTFRLTLPPHVAELRVSASASPGMTLRVDGFDAAESASTEGGQRVLVTKRQLMRGEAEMRELVITLGGLPTPGPGRWIAVIIALGLASSGVVTARASRASGGKARRLPAEDVARARDLLLNEIVFLERAKRQNAIGPRSYESARRMLMDGLARLEASPAQAAAS